MCRDEAGNWKSDAHEIPADDFEVIADLANLEIGWIDFGGNGQAPDFGWSSLTMILATGPATTTRKAFG